MKWFRHALCSVVFIFLSLFHPTVDANQCLDSGAIVDAKKGFCFTFKLDSDGGNRIRMRGPSNHYYPIWTDDNNFKRYSPLIYDEDYINEDKTRLFEVKFVVTSNPKGNQIKGVLTYYVDGIKKGSTKAVNLTKLVKVNKFNPNIKLEVIGSEFDDDYCISSGGCLPIPSDKPYSKNAQYEMGVKQCAQMPCTINFTKSYNYDPLVFLMPTIDSTAPKSDAPSRLYITSTLSKSSKSVTFDQDSLEHLSSGFHEVPMASISYIIMEPGVTKIDGHDVVAGYVSTNEYEVAGLVNAYNSESAEYEDFGLDGDFSREPVVLHQLQTNNNNGKWMTSGRHWSRDNDDRKELVELYLELGSSFDSTATYVDEKIAFLAAMPSGVLNDDLHKIQFKNDIVTGQQLDLNTTCNKFYDIGLDVKGVVAKKQRRYGTEGGWVRRCQVAGKQASFIVDEDKKSRTHTGEVVGYIVFAQKLPSIGKCPYFPTGLQTNSYFNDKPYSSWVLLTGNNNTIYFDEDVISSFNYSSASGGNNGCVYKGGSKGACKVDGDLTYAPDFPPKLPSFTIGRDSYVCKDGCQKTIYPGSYSRVDIGKNGELIFSPGVYFIDRLILSEGAGIKTNGKVVIHTRYPSINAKNVKINEGGNADDLLIIQHDSGLGLFITEENISITANMYFTPGGTSGVTVYGNNFTYKGALSVNSLSFNANNSSITVKTPDECPMLEEKYVITMTPSSSVGLMCGGAIPKFMLTATNQGSPVAAKVRLEVYKDKLGDSPYLSVNVLNGIGSQASGHFITDSNGRLSVGISSSLTDLVDLTSNYRIKATLIDAWADPIERTFTYVPFKFQASDVELIAGESSDVSLQVLACEESGQQVVAANYIGSPSVTHTVVMPDKGRTGLLSYSPDFGSKDKGVTKDPISLTAVGEFSVTLKDSNFSCLGFTNCPIDGKAELQGSFTVRSRPDRFVICPLDNSNAYHPATGDAYRGGGFFAAGVPFNLLIKPVSKTNASVSDICNFSDGVTPNYFLSDGKVKVEPPLLDSPRAGSIGVLAPDNYEQKTQTSDANLNGYFLNNGLGMSYSEVGSFIFKVKEEGAFFSSILGGVQGESYLGRFYPAKFNIESSVWVPPSGQGEAAYLSQPYNRAEVMVRAYPYSSDQPVKNYHLFSPLLQAGFYISQDSNIKNQLDMLTFKGHWRADSNGASHWYLSDTDAVLQRQVVSAVPLTTEANGPFNTSDLASVDTMFGLDIIGGPDPVSFDENVWRYSQPFPTQPPARYGRVAMGSVGGNTGETLSVPFRVEFWNGNFFETNTNDNATRLTTLSSHICKQELWSEGGNSSSELTGVDLPSKVENGESDVINANPGSNGAREQVQFWMRLGRQRPSGVSHGCNKTLTQPWLQHNWRGLEDEDPSTVVTFGIHRGNDRVIYRGENGLTGQ